MVPHVEEMNLETLDFATLDFNKDGFACSLRRKPKNDDFGSLVTFRHRNSTEIQVDHPTECGTGFSFLYFISCRRVFSYLGRMESDGRKKYGVDFWEKKGKGMGNDQCANRLDGEFFGPAG